MMALIGISGSIIKETAAPFSGYERAYVNDDYVNAVIEAGGVPVIIPVNTNETVLKDLMTQLDGLILSGGHDVNPSLYGENPMRKLGEIFPKRDTFDFLLIKHATAKQIPILGICRGFQVLNVYHGGSLYQDLDFIESELKLGHSQVSGPTITTHPITVNEESLFHSIIGRNTLDVNSFHHQAIKSLGEGLVAVAHADDGIVEVFESLQYPWMLGVQFHPEMLHREMEAMQAIFNRFVNASQGDK